MKNTRLWYVLCERRLLFLFLLQVFTSFEQCQQFVREFCSVHGLSEQELAVLLDLFPQASTDFSTLTLVNCLQDIRFQSFVHRAM